MRKLPAMVVLLVVGALGACGKENAPARHADTSDVSVHRLNPEQVPADLRHLIPLAERWGIGDDLERIAKVDRATSAEREALQAALTPVQTRITEWLDSFGSGAMTDEAAAFMFMQLALDEMTAGRPVR